MRASMAYFAGAGTVIAAIVGGVGGGLLIADMVSPKSPKDIEMTRLERRMSPEPIQVTSKPSEPVPYVAASQQLSGPAVAASVPAPSQAQTEAVNSASTAARPSDTAAASQPSVQLPQSQVAVAQPVAREQTVASQTVAAEDFKARDADAKRAADKRRVERRQQWTDRRRHLQRQEQELQAVEETVREETGPRREFPVEPARIQMRQIRLLGEE
jgi:hypothetical protein